MAKVHRKTRAVTLIELMVAISISGGVLVAVSGIFMGIRKQWSYSVTRGKAIEAAQSALDQIAMEARNGITYQATDGTKTNTFTLPANADAQGNYTPARVGSVLQYVGGARIRYYLSDATGSAGSGSFLWRETNAAPTGSTGWLADTGWSLAAGAGSKPKYNSVSSMAYSTTGLPSNMVQVSITVLVSEKLEQTFSMTLQRSVYLSNHN